MSVGTEVVVDRPPLMPPSAAEFDTSLDVELLDTPFISRGSDGVLLDDLDFDFSFDDLCLPSSDVLEDLLRPSHPQQPDLQPDPEPDFSKFAPNFDQFDGVIKSTSPELRHAPGDCGFSGDHSWDSSGLLNSASPEMESQQISGYLNMPSPESNRESTGNCDADSKGFNFPSPESGNFGSNVSEDSNDCTARSVSSSPNSSNSSIKIGVVDRKIKLDEAIDHNGENSSLKRKKEGEDSLESSPETKNIKYRKSSCSSDNNNTGLDVCGLNEEEEKRKIRLVRNRESAQLSRQRKKHYIEELEDKVRNMHSTIQDLNMKISYVMAENVTLRQQAGGAGGGGSAPAATPPPPMVPPPPPGMYPPHPAMMYPWMPCPPPYMMKSQGSQVPLLPIPRLKPQQSVQAPKENKKAKNRKSEGAKTKKVAGVSFLGLLFFIMLFGGLVPMVNVRFGGVREAFTGGETYSGSGFSEKHHGRVLMVNGSENTEKHGGRRDFKGCGNCKGESSGEEFVRMGNGSEHLAASLYVPRNDKMVKIDGNLIIHSVLASEKATVASHENGDGESETSLAFLGNLVPAVPVPDAGRNGARHPKLRALGSASADQDSVNPPATDGRLQQWFREGLAGPLMSAGMCTEVFQFDVSAAIVPVSGTRNLSEPKDENCRQPNKGRNRRILHPIPLPGSGHNVSTEHAGSSKKDNLSGNKNASSMVVSVLFDPREAGDADVEGVIGTKSLSRIFVVVLIDNVRYVTYSCMLPFKGIANHLVTA